MPHRAGQRRGAPSHLGIYGGMTWPHHRDSCATPEGVSLPLLGRAPLQGVAWGGGRLGFGANRHLATLDGVRAVVARGAIWCLHTIQSLCSAKLKTASWGSLFVLGLGSGSVPSDPPHREWTGNEISSGRAKCRDLPRSSSRRTATFHRAACGLPAAPGSKALTSATMRDRSAYTWSPRPARGSHTKSPPQAPGKVCLCLSVCAVWPPCAPEGRSVLS